MATPSHQVPNLGRGYTQIDGFFWDSEKRGYKIECKWEKHSTTPNEIRELGFRSSQVANVSGLFVSMSGFTDSAIDMAKELVREYQMLLMDGEELRAVLQGLTNFDNVISLKRYYLESQRDPYYRVIFTRESL